MVDNTLTLALEGDVSLPAFAETMRHFSNLVDALTKEVASDSEIIWEIEALQAGSALATVIGLSSQDEAVLRVVEAYDRVGNALEQRKPIPFSTNIAREAEQITKKVSNNITAVRFLTSKADHIIYGVFDPQKNIDTKTISIGTVTGRVQTITERNRLNFTMYDTIFDRSVTCYLPEKLKSRMPEIWGKVVEVTGLITREIEIGRPVSIREVTDIALVPIIKAGSYKQARGILDWKPGDEGAEVAIRRLRDANN
ncbi:hypothetical protein G4Y79_08815 [Phototrophicus methaneseepsis]|uniref:Uncharacterized protein n=1 Tax=Phototrophicus methaneseepsis TaxID=2710758 RepID=A0A7S8ECJ7_9CHLR|nr:hypothetical protein [Phototrophicus methaneseepsis]QPC84460.1 hypothetical protein G4Y79_08815 [Phototrophicus methaneseepsis]